MLDSFSFKPFYNSKTDNLITDFYEPALTRATEYKRVSAFFDSRILSLYSTGIENIIKNNGHVYFIFSNEITEKDFEEIKKGYELREEIQRKLVANITEDSPSINLCNLAYLVSAGYVDIKIAFTKDGILHDKFGLISDKTDTIYFRGSNNETVAAIENNFESFETSCTWDCDVKEENKINNAKTEFEKLWENKYEDTIVLDIPDVVKNKLISYSKNRLILNMENLPNTFVFDLNGTELIGYNNLTNPHYMLDDSMWYRGYIKSHVINDPSLENRNYIFKKDLSYLQMIKLINIVFQRGLEKDFNIYQTPRLQKYLLDCDIQCEKRRSLGIAIKKKDPLILDDFRDFSLIVNDSMERELREPQMWGAYHIAKMIRSANFSVPGSGKTSIVYGAFAYLLSKKIVDKIVMIGPINSFMAWKNEFELNFGAKLKLNVYDYHQQKYKNAEERFDGIVSETRNCNLILFNYESVQQNYEALKSIIDSKTLLVFDEVHRIKSTSGVRASSCYGVSKNANFKVVLTGTPIPNGYVDIYNFLHILFPDEYDILFNFDESYLQSANTSDDKKEALNKAIYPFFCRTNKRDLKVPEPEPDDITTGYCTFGEDFEKLLEIVYRNCRQSTLLLYIRLMQASTNPKLICSKLTKEDIHSFDSDIDYDDFTTLFGETVVEENYTEQEKEFIKSFGMTEKFNKAINLARKLVDEHNQVVIWEVFVDTIATTRTALLEKGIKCEVIYGKTPVDEREQIIRRFINKEFDVLITNPHTLAESVSLHKNCHHAIYLEYSFNLVHMLQSRDRIHRLGLKDTDKTYYYYMMMDNPDADFNTIDMKIYDRLKEKEQIQKDAVEGDNLVYTPDTFEEDIKELLKK